MEYSYDFSNEGLWASDCSATMTPNHYVPNNPHGPAGAPNTLTESRRLNPANYGQVFESIRNNSYYQDHSTSFNVGGTGQLPKPPWTNFVVTSRPNHSFDIGLPYGTAYQNEELRRSEYLSPGTIGIIPSPFQSQPTMASTLIPTQASASNMGPYFCAFGCGKYFTRKKDMERHAGAHMPLNLWCHVAGCHKGFYRKDKLKEHLRKHEGDIPLVNGANV